MKIHTTIEWLYGIAAVVSGLGLAAAFADKLRDALVCAIAILAGLSPWMTFLGRPLGGTLVWAGMIASVPLFILALVLCAFGKKTPNQRAVLAVLLGGMVSGVTFFLAAGDLLGQIG